MWKRREKTNDLKYQTKIMLHKLERTAINAIFYCHHWQTILNALQKLSHLYSFFIRTSRHEHIKGDETLLFYQQSSLLWKWCKSKTLLHFLSFHHTFAKLIFHLINDFGDHNTRSDERDEKTNNNNNKTKNIFIHLNVYNNKTFSSKKRNKSKRHKCTENENKRKIVEEEE